MTMTQAEAIEYYTAFNQGEFGQDPWEAAWEKFVDAMGKLMPEYRMDGVFLDCGFDLFREGMTPKQAIEAMREAFPDAVEDMRRDRHV